MQLHPAFKPLIAAVVGGWLAMGAVTASAQMTPQTADMSVTGTIVPAACSASFTGNGEVDFSTIKLIDLQDNVFNRLGTTKDVTLNVNCSANKYVTFSVTDLQSTNAIADAAMTTALGSAAGADYVFGLGTATVGGNTVSLGSYAIQLVTITANDAAGTGGTRYSVSATGGALWASATNAWLSKATNVRYGVATWSSPYYYSFPLTSVQVGMQVRAALNKGSALQVSDDTKLNGQAVFAISYQ